MCPYVGLFDNVITSIKVHELQWIEERESGQEALAACETTGFCNEKIGIITIERVNWLVELLLSLARR